MKLILASFVCLFAIGEAYAVTPIFLDIARNSNGTVMHMSQIDALKYCSDQGAHLPSAREISQLSMSLGASGITSKCEGSDIRCYEIKPINDENFYFSSSGYQRPEGELGKNWFWSSSISALDTDLAFVMYGENGIVGRYYADYDGYFAVRCVAGRP